MKLEELVAQTIGEQEWKIIKLEEENCHLKDELNQYNEESNKNETSRFNMGRNKFIEEAYRIK